MLRKLGDTKQIVSVYDICFQGGKEDGKHGFLVTVGEMEALLNKDNALDIVWVKYCGVNVSFLSKNGMNSNIGEFKNKFDGGFLYTCGMDNVNVCRAGYPVHGSLHYQKAENAYYRIEDGKVIVGGVIKQTALFGENVCLKREYIISENSIGIFDTVENNGFADGAYALLYHINYGYPFLDECLEIRMPLIKSEGVTDHARKRRDKQFSITPPVDGGMEEVFYNYVKEGRVELINKQRKLACLMEYDTKDFPVTVEWKSMVSGDYALGIEPSTTRFDEFKMETLKSGEKKSYKIKITFRKE